MALQFTTTAELAVTQGVKMLVYGGSGAGKTVLLATLTKPVIISAERGLLSISPKNLRKIFGAAAPKEEIPVIVIESVEDLMLALEWCKDPDNQEHFDSIALDSVTEIAEKVLSYQKAIAGDPRQAYGELIEKMTMVLKEFRDLSRPHVVFVAKEQRNPDSADTLNGPAMPGSKLAEQLPYLFDEVFHLAIGEDAAGNQARLLQTNKDIQFVAKDRSGSLSASEQPNLTNIIRKIQANVR